MSLHLKNIREQKLKEDLGIAKQEKSNTKVLLRSLRDIFKTVRKILMKIEGLFLVT